MLTGARGRAAVDVRAAAEAAAALSRVAAAHPEIAEIEINPLLVTPAGAVGLDARVVLASRHSEPAKLGSRRWRPSSHSTSRARGQRLRVIAAVAVLVCAAVAARACRRACGHAAHRRDRPAATLRDPANDVRAGDIDLRSISVGKRNGALVVRFTVRRPITDNVSYTASVKAGAGSWALVARRSAGVDSFLLYNLATGTTTTVSGAIDGRTATVRAPI